MWVGRDAFHRDGGVNVYRYVGFDPINNTDPEGKLGVPACAVTLSFCAGFTVGNQLAKFIDALISCNSRVQDAKREIDECSPEESRRAGAERADVYWACVRDFMGFNAGDVIEAACAAAILRACV